MDIDALLGALSDEQLAELDDILWPTGDGFALPGNELTWRDWLAAKFAHVATAPLAPRHERLWEWFDSLRDGEYYVPRLEVWPRGGGKSATVELGLARAAVRLSRRFALYCSETQPQADAHVASIGQWLESAGAQPAISMQGRPRAWRRNQLQTANGFNVAAFGLDAGQRGVRIEQYRPDIIILDDIDNRHDSALVTIKKSEVVRQTILPTGAPHCLVVVAQNLVKAGGIVDQLASNRAGWLLDRELATLEVAVEDLEVEAVEQAGGLEPKWRIVSGRATWAGQDLAIAERQINAWGLDTFLRESQHEVRHGSTFFPMFDAKRHLAAPIRTPQTGIPAHWTVCGGVDWGFAAPFAFVLVGVDEHGTVHGIESLEGVNKTDSDQASIVSGILDKWGVAPDRCTIGFDDSMRYQESKTSLPGQPVVNAFHQAGLRMAPVVNNPAAALAGFGIIRDLLRAPGVPTPKFVLWKGFTQTLAHALANAEYDRLDPEKIAHDECSHTSHALRYALSTQPQVPDAPARELTVGARMAIEREIVQSAADVVRADMLRRRNKAMGIENED